MNPEQYKDIRKFTKERPESQEERNQLAQDIRQQRKEYFSNRGNLNAKSEELKKQMEQKEIDLAQAREDVKSLQESLDKSKENFILKLFDFIKLRQLKEKTGVMSELQIEIASVSMLISELDQQIADKQKILSTKESIAQFYRDKTIELQEYNKEQEFRSAKHISEAHDVLFVHGLLHMRGPVENSALKDESIDFETKLKILLGLDPTVSVSSIRSGDTRHNIWTGAGVLLKNGVVRKAFPTDAGTQVKNLRERSVNTYDPRIEFAEKKDIYGQIDDAINLRSPKEYNEFILENPEVAGLYVYLPSEADTAQDYGGQSVSDEMVVEASRDLDLPIYGLREGNPCKVAYNEELRKLEYVKDVDRSEILENQFNLDDEQRREMVKSILTENSPFKSEIEEAIKQ